MWRLGRGVTPPAVDKPAAAMRVDAGAGVGRDRVWSTPATGVGETAGGLMGWGEMVAGCSRHWPGQRRLRVLGACERWVVDVSWVRLCWCLDVVLGWKVRGCRWGVESSWWDSPYTEEGKKRPCPTGKKTPSTRCRTKHIHIKKFRSSTFSSFPLDSCAAHSALSAASF